jgi:hypothetical protein
MPSAPTAEANATTDQFVCPECGRSFARAASLGAHRRQAHKIPGATTKTSMPAATAVSAQTTKTSRRRRARRTTRPANRTTTDNGPNRDALLEALFPEGIPPKESVIRSVNAWLDEAERLAQLR